eukprot:Unigene6193_Nuclearia_a/m.19054 Unigene6193_Nuclearia_a/g.19054  ORF Unigene6193_Nuclearia_a/g.19054 Unigene6193_Nuclearia_a/m.19054 type:complete len:331 (+) Unigene6193_Nuclearia_a:1426-2418(+)
MCTPTSHLPSGRCSMCRASSRSRAVGGSMLNTRLSRTSRRRAISSGVVLQGVGGRHAITSGLNSSKSTSCSRRMPVVSASTSPTAPSSRTTCPRGYCDVSGQTVSSCTSSSLRSSASSGMSGVSRSTIAGKRVFFGLKRRTLPVVALRGVGCLPDASASAPRFSSTISWPASSTFLCSVRTATTTPLAWNARCGARSSSASAALASSTSIATASGSSSLALVLPSSESTSSHASSSSTLPATPALGGSAGSGAPGASTSAGALPALALALASFAAALRALRSAIWRRAISAPRWRCSLVCTILNTTVSPSNARLRAQMPSIKTSSARPST